MEMLPGARPRYLEAATVTVHPELVVGHRNGEPGPLSQLHTSQDPGCWEQTCMGLQESPVTP